MLSSAGAAFSTILCANGDPVFALIDAHKLAFAAWGEALDMQGRGEADDAAVDLAQAAANRLAARLLKAWPGSIAGVVAQLRYVASCKPGAFPYGENESEPFIKVAKSAAAALEAMARA
jgi:hypothetical protein